MTTASPARAPKPVTIRAGAAPLDVPGTPVDIEPEPVAVDEPEDPLPPEPPALAPSIT